MSTSPLRLGEISRKAAFFHRRNDTIVSESVPHVDNDVGARAVEPDPQPEVPVISAVEPVPAPGDELEENVEQGSEHEQVAD